MMIEEIRELFAYNRWANGRLLDAAGELSDEELRRDLGGSFSSVHGTLEHIALAEWIWLQRWRGESPAGPPEEWDASTLERLRERWRSNETGQSSLLEELDDERLMSDLQFRNTRGDPFHGRLDWLMRHVVNHSTYHRGQVASMLRRLGRPVPPTDLVFFQRERTRP